MRTLAFFALLMPSISCACLNVSGTKLDGQRIETGRVRVSSLRHAMQEKPSRREAIDHFGHGKSELDLMERRAIDLIYRGDLQSALALLNEAEVKEPDRYDTAGNIGTAYELMGDNVNALKWITKEIKLNPEAHQSSEWLHALILNAKIEAAKHPDTPLIGRLIDVPERLNAGTEIKVGESSYSASEVSESIYHQLRERMLFVKPKDPYVADLLYSCALIEANLGVVEQGLGLLKLAREYGFPDESLLREHERQYESIIVKGRIMWWLKWGPLILVILLALTWTGWKHRQRQWFRFF
jgi:tetratricopeptide (TPR) repeat protein